MLCQTLFIFLFLTRDMSKTATRSSRRWQIGCSRLYRQVVGFWTLWSDMQPRQGGSKRSLLLPVQLHKIQHGGKTDSLIEKAVCFGRMTSLPISENRTRICQGTAEIYWCEYKHGGARLTTREFVKGRLRSIDANINTEALDSQHCIVQCWSPCFIICLSLFVSYLLFIYKVSWHFCCGCLLLQFAQTFPGHWPHSAGT